MSIRRNTLWNLAGALLPMLVGIVTIPYLINKIGVEAFGILTLIWALIGYFSLFDFGLGRALTQKVSSARASGNESKLPGLIKAGILSTAITGAVGGVILIALSRELSTNWLKVSLDLQSSTQIALVIAAFGIPVTTVTTGLRGLLEAFEEFKAINILRIVLGVASFVLPALSVMFICNSLVWMVLSLIAARGVILIMHAWLIFQTTPDGLIHAAITMGDLRRLFSFGAWMSVSNIIGPLMVTADRFVLSGLLGAGFVAFYTVPFDALSRLLVLPGSLSAALFPRLAAMMVANPCEVRRLYIKALISITFLMLPICVVLVFGSRLMLSIWLGEEFAERSWVIVCIISFGIFFNGVASIPFALLQAAGYARITAYLHFFELVLYVPGLYFAIKTFGVAGAAIAWSFRTLLDMILLLIKAGQNPFSPLGGRPACQIVRFTKLRRCLGLRK